MDLKTLKPKTKNKARMTVGRGGKRGKTAGRGTKGQNARAGRKKRPELRDFIKRIPKLRGRGVNQFKSIVEKPFNINVGHIEANYKAGEIVNAKTLVEKGVLSLYKGNLPKVKILGNGDITKKINIEKCIVSAQAKEKIEKAGGLIQ